MQHVANRKCVHNIIRQLQNYIAVKLPVKSMFIFIGAFRLQHVAKTNCSGNYQQQTVSIQCNTKYIYLSV